MIRPLKFIPENKSCARLLREFQVENISVAAVVDEYGGTAGIITMDDLVDEVFGEVAGEGKIRRQNQNTWLMDAGVELDLLESELGLSFGEVEAETLAGYILGKTGRIPGKNAQIDFEGFRIEIVQVSLKRIERVKLIITSKV